MEEILTPAEMGRADALADNEAALMAAAGRAVARAVLRKYQPCRTLVLLGPGNNGGDGKVAARFLSDSGWPVTLAPFSTATVAQVAGAELVIDAVFGAGLSRDVSSPVADLLRAARRLVAIDVPSGVHGATGAVRGYAPQAELTVTFFRLKPGHLLYPGRGLCGEILLRDIGLPASVLDSINPQTFRNGPWLWTLPARGAAAGRDRCTERGGWRHRRGSRLRAAGRADGDVLPTKTGASTVPRPRPLRRDSAPRHRPAGVGAGQHQAANLSQRAMALDTAGARRDRA